MQRFLEGMIPGIKEHAMDQQVRMKAGTVGSVTGICINLLLSGLKAAVGLLMGSVSVVADAVNNLSDAAGSVMALVTMRLAQKPMDREHPYGHGRMEYIGALGVGVMILLLALELFRSAIGSIISPEKPQFSWWMLLVLGFSIAAKAWLWCFYDRLGKRIDSAALLAASKDAMSDMIATSSVILCMVLSPMTELPLDGVMGLVVAALVCKAGVDVCRDMLDSLLGSRPDPELGRQIIHLVEAREGILGTHDLMLHDYGPGRCVASIHAEVSADMSILDAHELIDLVEQEVSSELNIPLCIHMDPIVTGDEETDRVKHELAACLQQLSHEYRLHDLRRVPGEKRINLVFDVAVPADVRDTSPITEALQARARELDPRHCCVIHYDIDYFHA